ERKKKGNLTQRQKARVCPDKSSRERTQERKKGVVKTALQVRTSIRRNQVAFLPGKVGIFSVRAIFPHGQEASPHPLSCFRPGKDCFLLQGCPWIERSTPAYVAARLTIGIPGDTRQRRRN